MEVMCISLGDCLLQFAGNNGCMPLDNVIARSQSSTLACVRIKICPRTLADKAEHISVLVF